MISRRSFFGILAAAPVAALVKVDAPQRAVPAMSIEEALLYGDASSAPGEFQGLGVMYPGYVTTDQIASGAISADKIRIVGMEPNSILRDLAWREGTWRR